MKQAEVVKPIQNPNEGFPAGGGAFLLIAALGVIAWLVFSLVYADASRPSELRRIDGLWGWVILALFQLMLRPQGKSKALQDVVFVLIVFGLAATIFRYSWDPEHQLVRSLLAVGEAIVVTLAVIATAMRGMTHLSGRAVKAADIWMFVAMQWLLVWAAADLVLTWRNFGEPLIDMRRRLTEMLLFGAGVHTAIGVAMTYVTGPKASVRDRASLATLAFYNVGLILMLFGLLWWGSVPMFLGIALFLTAASTLLQGESVGRSRFAPLLLFAGCMFAMAACMMRPFDWFKDETTLQMTLFAGWRHATGGGCVALCVLAALGVSATEKIPEKYKAGGVIAVGAVLFMLGIVTRIVAEASDAPVEGVNKIAVIGSILEMAGFGLVGIAALRARALRARSTM